MVRFSITLVALACCLRGADTLTFRSGPFEVISTAGEREGREVLNYVEQLRYALGMQLGVPDLQPVWPVRVLVVRQRATVAPTPKLGRDAWMCSITAMNPQTSAGIVQILLDSAPGQLPPPIARGLLQLYSMLQVDGTRVTLGATPAQKDRDWALAHMLAVHPEYSGKLRVLLGNLSRGVDRDVAYRNAFSQTPENVERALDSYLTAGEFSTIPAPSRPLNARRELIAKETDELIAMLAAADLQLAHGQAGAKAAYDGLLRKSPASPEVNEGLGLLAAQAGDRERASTHLKLGTSARAFFETAKLTSSPADKRALLMKAAAANARWAEPHVALAELEAHPAQKLAALRKAAELAPRRADIWIALATLQESSKQFPEAAKSWAAAERTTDDPGERDRVRQFRLAGDNKRMEAERAAREEARRKTEEELETLRNKALLEIRAAEARANAGKPVIDPKGLDEYKEGGSAKQVSGTLTRVDCTGSAARLNISAGRQTTRILVSDPSKVAVAGGGQLSFSCGPQKPARAVRVEYSPRTDSGQGTAGDAISIEFKQ